VEGQPRERNLTYFFRNPLADGIMNNPAIQNFTLEWFTFEQVYQEPAVKAVFLTASVACSCFTVPLCCGIISFERNNRYRNTFSQNFQLSGASLRPQIVDKFPPKKQHTQISLSFCNLGLKVF
jgi:hypothetical protein